MDMLYRVLECFPICVKTKITKDVKIKRELKIKTYEVADTNDPA